MAPVWSAMKSMVEIPFLHWYLNLSPSNSSGSNDSTSAEEFSPDPSASEYNYSSSVTERSGEEEEEEVDDRKPAAVIKGKNKLVSVTETEISEEVPLQSASDKDFHSIFIANNECFAGLEHVSLVINDYEKNRETD